MSKPLIIYGVPFSQPVRAVLWLMLYKQKPFQMVLINPGSSSEGGSRHPDYLDKFQVLKTKKLDLFYQSLMLL